MYSNKSLLRVQRSDWMNHPILKEPYRVRQYYGDCFRYLVGVLSDGNEELDDYIEFVCRQTVSENYEDCQTVSKKDFLTYLKRLNIVGQYSPDDGTYEKVDYRAVILLDAMYIIKISNVQNKRITGKKINVALDLIADDKKSRTCMDAILKLIFVDKDLEACKAKIRESFIGFTRELLIWRVEDIDWNWNFRTGPEVHISVVATMSAGKSTFVNALLGAEFIPSKNEACTAKVTSIYDNDRLDRMIGFARDHRNYYDEMHHSIDKDRLEEWNHDDSIKRIIMEGDLEGIRSTKFTIVIHDTPGTNFSQDRSHGEMTFEFLDEISSDLYVYIINAEQITVDDNKILLQQIHDFMRKRNKGKILFLVNKIDSFDTDKDDDIRESLKGIRKMLTSYGFQDFNIIPVSAEAARLFKKALGDEELSNKEKRDFEFFHELFVEDQMDLRTFNEKEFPVSSSIDELSKAEQYIKIRRRNYALEDIVEGIHRSGITTVEGYINQLVNN